MRTSLPRRRLDLISRRFRAPEAEVFENALLEQNHVLEHGRDLAMDLSQREGAKILPPQRDTALVDIPKPTEQVGQGRLSRP